MHVLYVEQKRLESVENWAEKALMEVDHLKINDLMFDLEFIAIIKKI